MCGPTHFALMLIDLCAFSKTCYCRSRFQQSAVKPRDPTMCAAPLVRMGLDVTDKLLCYFAMALGNDGITHQTIKSYLSAVHWPGSRIQRVPRSCGTSKGTRPLCLLLGGTVRLGGAISPHPQTWCYNAHHDPWSTANDR